jgi:hypothetical protein
VVFGSPNGIKALIFGSGGKQKLVTEDVTVAYVFMQVLKGQPKTNVHLALSKFYRYFT